mmetsp:Transcript_11683/g.28356  ORF Transcript_11683/g.28356 Transcript_11683/m.28356 type:complete len:184 (+) Transcript_11683:746-1297(+)
MRLAYTPLVIPMSSTCVPCSFTTPSVSTATESAPWMVDSRCAITMEVRPSIMVSSAALTNRSLSASNADVASSNRSTCGLTNNARAMAMRCFCPPLSLMPLSPTHVSRPFSKLRTNSATLACSSAFHIWSSVASGAPNLAFERMLRANNTGSWLTTPMMVCRCLWSMAPTGTPATRMVPELGS